VLEGVRCQLIGDNEAGYYIHRVDCVLVGAQAILEDGSILNRAGTFQIALLAKHHFKPFYVFAESYKFLKRNYLTQADIPQRFIEEGPRKVRTIMIDLTPPQFISMFCTDNGVYNPETIALELAKILK
jgi:translation initiation factor eIF-2B subunit alpha